MATSDTFTSKRYGNSSVGPYLTLAWTQVSQSVANNTTTLDLTLRFHWSASINYTFRSKAGSVQGHSYTYSGSVSGNSGSRVLKTQRVTINHNSNGARSVTLSGNITGLGLTYSGNRINTMSVSGTANLETIPRASTLSAFSFNAHLKNGVANQINYTVDKKSDDFRHQIQLRDGNTVIRTWDNQSSDGKSTVPLTASEVNNLLNRMSSTTTKSYTLRVATRSGVNGGWIGSAVSRNATARVNDDVKPSVSNAKISVAGSGHDNALGMYIRHISKVGVSFSRNAGYGATIQSSKSIVRKTGGEDSQTIDSNDGTTGRNVSLYGQYEVYAEVRDSRGRTEYTLLGNFLVEYYKAPVIDRFRAKRRQGSPLVVDITRSGSYAPVSGYNNLTINIQKRLGSGSWSNVVSDVVTTEEIYSGGITSTGNEVTNTYDFKLRVTDSFGNFAESVVTLPTQRVVLDIHKNSGVGIGKIHERGALDVDGSAYFRGDLHVNNVNITNAQLISEMGTTANTIAFWDSLPQGIYHVYPNQIPGQPTDYGIMYHSRRGGDFFSTIWYSQPSGTIFRKSGNANEMSQWTPIDRPDTGTNENGRWVRFNDGTQICNGVFSHDFGANIDAFATFPKAFFNTEYTVSISSASSNWRPTEISRNVGVAINTTTQVKFNAQRNLTTGTYAYRYLAVGRWR